MHLTQAITQQVASTGSPSPQPGHHKRKCDSPFFIQDSLRKIDKVTKKIKEKFTISQLSQKHLQKHLPVVE